MRCPLWSKLCLIQTLEYPQNPLSETKYTWPPKNSLKCFSFAPRTTSILLYQHWSVLEYRLLTENAILGMWVLWLRNEMLQWIDTVCSTVQRRLPGLKGPKKTKTHNPLSFTWTPTWVVFKGNCWLPRFNHEWRQDIFYLNLIIVIHILRFTGSD